jgi:hypothetical protein
VNRERSRAYAYVDASAVADYLGCSRCWVYENADKLGARRLGSGPKARLRFSLDDVDTFMTSCSCGRKSAAQETPALKPTRCSS